MTMPSPAVQQGKTREDHLRQAHVLNTRKARMDISPDQRDHIYRHAGTGRRTVVPVHGNRNLKPGTRRAIMRDTFDFIDSR